MDVSDIVKGAIHHKKMVYFAVAILIALGITGLVYMNKDEFPTFEIKNGLIAGIYPGADAEEVEKQLTEPLEDVLFSFSEISRDNTSSYSRNGMCYIYTDLTTPASTKNEVWSKIKLKLDAVRQTLPPGVLAVAVMDDFSAVSSLLIALESDDKGYSEMKGYAEELSLRLQTIPELANARIIGGQNDEIAVTLDMERLSAYGISPSSIMLACQASGLQLGSGNFSTGYASSPIRIENTVASEREIAEKIVYSDPQGNILRLKDIATVERRWKKPSSLVSHNGNTAVIISVEMRPDNNIVAFGRDVDEVLSEFGKTLPDSVHVSKITDQPHVVGSSVLSFLRDLVISMIVVILVMLMLFPMKSALIASSGVPVCTAVAIAIMFLTGIDLNTVSLAALIVVLGMIVDDSIINMDGYMDKLGRGMGRIEAACASAKELFMPMFTATFAISVMFFPAKVLITGYLGDFVTNFPWVIAIALGASLAYAVLVVPSLEVRYIKSAKNTDKGIISRGQTFFFNAMQNGYEKMETLCFRHPKLTILAGAAAVALGILMFFNVNIQLMPKAARECFVVEIYLESGSGIDRTKEVSDSLEKILLKDKRITSVTSFVGTSSPRFHATYAPQTPSPDFAQFIVNTTSVKATESVLRDYEADYHHYFTDAVVRFKQMDYQAVSAPVEVRIKGDDYYALQSVADTIRHFMYASLDDRLQWIHSSADGTSSFVDVSLDPDEASRLGVSRSMLSLALAGAFNSIPIASVWEGDAKIPVNLYSEAVSDTMSYDVIANQMVATNVPGVSVPLRQIADIVPQWRPDTYLRTGGVETITVAADMKYGYSQPEAMREIKRYVEEKIEPGLPEGITISYGGLSSMNGQVGPEILVTFFCAVAILFLFLLVHFKKVSIAVLTLVLSSLCLFGAFFGLWLFGLDFGLTSVLGLISLVGIIVRNGILMFEYAEELRFEKGWDVKSASVEAGKRRMRPIFLTSCTTALGVLPMIISGDALWMPMGVVICFGTMLSIILITLIMPVSYWQIFKNADNVSSSNEKEAVANEK